MLELTSRNPLSGKHLLQLTFVQQVDLPDPEDLLSQSPFGEASLATGK